MGASGGKPVTRESLSWEGPGVTICCHRERTDQKGAWISLRISAVPLGSEDKPTSLKRLNLTLFQRTPFICPRSAAAVCKNDAASQVAD